MVKNEKVLFDGNYNNMGSEYIKNNYGTLLNFAEKLVGESAVDLLNDVFIAVIEDENNGEGYDENLGLTVDEYIYGRIKGYSRNSRYRTGSWNEGKLSFISACSDERNLEEMDGIQKAYNLCAIRDEYDIGDVESSLYLLIKYKYENGVDLINLIRNIDIINSVKSIAPMLKNLPLEIKEALEDVLSIERSALLNIIDEYGL
ncbi:MAG: hypothetical protein QXD03_05340 [Candidatus Anstonellales archaeon]